jgi:hypothetical protein
LSCQEGDARWRSNQNDLQRSWPAQPRQRLLIEFDDPEIHAPDDEKRRGAHNVESVAGEVGPSATRDYSADSTRKIGRRDKGSRSAGAGAE